MGRLYGAALGVGEGGRGFVKSVPVGVKPPGRRRTGFRCFWVAVGKAPKFLCVSCISRALRATRRGMAATGTAVATATGKLLVLLLLGLTAPAAALAGYIEVGTGRAPERSLLRPPWERGLPAGQRASGPRGPGRVGGAAWRAGSGGGPALRRVWRRLPRPLLLGAVLSAGGRAASAAAEAK